MLPLIKKELKILFASPMAAVVFSLFLFLNGFVFTATVTQGTPPHLPEASLRGMTYFIGVMLLFIAPLLTMKLFAEEKKSGTIELLKTVPLSSWALVVGKFLAVWALFAMLLILTVEFPILLHWVGDPDPWPMILSYLGLLLLSGALLAVGLFCSALTKNQLIAALLAFVLLLTLWFLAEVGGPLGEEVSMVTHLEGFSLGVIDLADAGYYLLLIGVSLFATVQCLEVERWK